MALFTGACAYSEPDINPRYLTGQVTIDRASGILANGHDQLWVQVLLHDNHGNPVADMPVRMVSNGGGNQFDYDEQTNSDGIAMGTLRSTEAGFKTISIMVTTAYAEHSLGQRPEVRFVPHLQESLRLSPATTLATAGNPRAVAVGDVNGDGHLDVVAANWSASSVAVFFGRQGGLHPQAKLLTVGPTPRALIAVPKVGTGSASLYIAHSTLAQLSHYPSINTDDALPIPSTTATELNPRALATGPWQGGQGVAVANGGSNSLTIFSHGDATEIGNNSAQLAVAGQPRTVRAYPLANGTAAWAVGYENKPNIHIYASVEGDWVIAQTLPTEEPVVDFDVADLNGDGLLDIAAIIHTHVHLFFGATNSPAMADLPPLPVGPATSLALGDLTGNGRADLITAQLNPQLVEIFLNSGSGQLESFGTIASGQAPTAVRCHDLDADGRMDLLWANQGDGTITVHYNLPPL